MTAFVDERIATRKKHTGKFVGVELETGKRLKHKAIKTQRKFIKVTTLKNHTTTIDI